METANIGNEEGYELHDISDSGRVSVKKLPLATLPEGIDFEVAAEQAEKNIPWVLEKLRKNNISDQNKEQSDALKDDTLKGTLHSLSYPSQNIKLNETSETVNKKDGIQEPCDTELIQNADTDNKELLKNVNPKKDKDDLLNQLAMMTGRNTPPESQEETEKETNLLEAISSMDDSSFERIPADTEIQYMSYQSKTDEPSNSIEHISTKETTQDMANTQLSNANMSEFTQLSIEVLPDKAPDHLQSQNHEKKEEDLNEEKENPVATTDIAMDLPAEKSDVTTTTAETETATDTRSADTLPEIKETNCDTNEPMHLGKSNSVLNTDQICEHIAKLQHQQSIIKEEIRNIIISDNDFTENKMYIKLSEKLSILKKETDKLQTQIETASKAADEREMTEQLPSIPGMNTISNEIHIDELQNCMENTSIKHQVEKEIQDNISKTPNSPSISKDDLQHGKQYLNEIVQDDLQIQQQGEAHMDDVKIDKISNDSMKVNKSENVFHQQTQTPDQHTPSAIAKNELRGSIIDHKCTGAIPKLSCVKNKETENQDIASKMHTETSKKVPNLTRPNNMTENTEDTCEEIAKIQKQLSVIEKEITKIIVKNDQFLENETYIKLEEKQDKLKKYMDKLQKRRHKITSMTTHELEISELDLGYLNTVPEPQDNVKPPPIPTRPHRSEKSLRNMSLSTGKTKAKLPSEIPHLTRLEIEKSRKQDHISNDPAMLYLNADIQETINQNDISEQKQVKAIQDTWQCSNCDFINDAMSRTCDVCNEVNNNFDLIIERNQVQRNNEALKTDTWKCEYCTFDNPLDVTVCRVCCKTGENIPTRKTIKVTSQPNPQEISQPWSCAFCTFGNNPDVKICVICGKSKTASPMPPLQAVLLEEKVDWDCEQCGFVNPVESEACQVCADIPKREKEEWWRCELCTFVNSAASGECDACHNPAVKSKPSVDEIMLMGKFNREAVDNVLESNKNTMEEIIQVLIEQHLQPIIATIWDDYNDPNVDMGNIVTSTEIMDPAILCMLRDKNIEYKKRVETALLEGNLEHSFRAEAAIALIDDPDLLGEVEDLTIQHILDCVKTGYGDVEECKNRLVQQCVACTDTFIRDQVHQLTFCECHTCTECFTHSFCIAIKEKNVVEWTCPVCHKPNLKEPANREGHFAFLDIKLQKYVDKETYELFTKKLADWNLQQREDFVWCANEKCNNGFLREGFRKSQCPTCGHFMCWQCKIAWVEAHTNRTCEEFRAFIQTQEEQDDIRGTLRKGGITCPNCRHPFDLAKGGCMHFTCSQCKHEFCSGCYEEIIRSRQKGLCCQHPRDCLFYLRDSEIDFLEDLIKMHNVQAEIEETLGESISGECPINELKEDVDGEKRYKDEPCGRNVTKAGLCQLHYKEHLVRIINQHRLDPADAYDIEEMKIVLNREKIPFDARGPLQRLRDILKGAKPLKEQPY